MSKFVNIVTRYVAPFGYGFCMAALVTAESFDVMAPMMLLSYVFAVLSISTGRRILEQGLARISHILDGPIASRILSPFLS